MNKLLTLQFLKSFTCMFIKSKRFFSRVAVYIAITLTFTALMLLSGLIPDETLINSPCGRIASLRGARNLNIFLYMPRFPRSVRLALHPAQRINQCFPNSDILFFSDHSSVFQAKITLRDDGIFYIESETLLCEGYSCLRPVFLE